MSYYTGGYNKTAGYHTHEYTPDDIDKGIILNPLSSPNTEDVYRSSTWVANTVSTIEPEEIEKFDIDQSVWIEARARGNQKGFKASTQIHGPEWYSVSNIQKPEDISVTLDSKIYNVNAASFKSGHSILPVNLGKDLKGASRVLQRAPGDLFITGSSKHNDQIVVNPGGVSSGLEGVKLKLA